MGSRPKVPPPPPPPPAPKDEADVVDIARLMMQRQARGGGLKAAFFGGPRGPGGPAWQAPEVTTPPVGYDYDAAQRQMQVDRRDRVEERQIVAARRPGSRTQVR